MAPLIAGITGIVLITLISLTLLLVMHRIRQSIVRLPEFKDLDP